MVGEDGDDDRAANMHRVAPRTPGGDGTLEGLRDRLALGEPSGGRGNGTPITSPCLLEFKYSLLININLLFPGSTVFLYQKVKI